MDQSRARLGELLGGRTVAQFASLPPEDRRAIFHQYLVQGSPAVIDGKVTLVEDTSEYFMALPVQPDRDILLSPYLMGDDDFGRQLIDETRQIFYGENDFVMHLYSFRHFVLDGYGGAPTNASLASFITGEVTFVVALHDESNEYWECDLLEEQADEEGEEEDMDEDEDEDEDEFDPNFVDDISRECNDPASVHYRHGDGKVARSAQKRLQEIFTLNNAKRITLAFQGDGLLDGSDLATHQTIKDLSYAIKLLIDHFGDRFTVKKILGADDDFTGRVSPSRDLRSYWDAPSEIARERVRQGHATFEQLIQVEIEEWTKVLPDPFVEGEWKMLD